MMNPPMINQAGVFFLSFFFFFFLMLLSSTTAVVRYDYSILALTWPKSYCVTQRDGGRPCKDINNVPSRFTVHGLWPDVLIGEIDLKSCSKDKLDPSALAPEVRRQAIIGWPDLDYYTDNETKPVYSGMFWQREWIKHGACSNLQPNAYMEFALRRYGKLLPQISQAIKLLPYPRHIINPVEFSKKIATASGYIPMLVCKNLTNPPYNQYLTEVRFNVSNISPYNLQDMEKTTNCVPTRPVNFPQ